MADDHAIPAKWLCDTCDRSGAIAHAHARTHLDIDGGFSRLPRLSTSFGQVARTSLKEFRTWFLRSAAPPVVPVAVAPTRPSRPRTRRFARTAAPPSVRTPHARLAATCVPACRSRPASRPPDPALHARALRGLFCWDTAAGRGASARGCSGARRRDPLSDTDRLGSRKLDAHSAHPGAIRRFS